MAKKVNYSEELKNEIEVHNVNNNYNRSKGFLIKNTPEKKEKTKFLVSIEKEKLKALDKLAKKNKVSRNELIKQFIDYILEEN